MQEFLVYKITNQPLVSEIGSWRKTDAHTKNGFIISDAHAQCFWTFEPENSVPMHEIELPVLPDFDLEAIDIVDYLKRSAALIEEMKEVDILKVVYSRIKAVPFNYERVFSIFDELIQHYPNNFNYCLYNSQTGFWMGSSPEILIQGKEDRFKSMALAGTLPIDFSNDSWTKKEFEEQEYVAQYLENLIAEHGSLLQKSERYVFPVGPVKHLKNDFHFMLKQDRFWDFLADFHPTPAVCGVPKSIAKLHYEKYEAHERLLYTGIIGFVNKNQSDQDAPTTSLYVNLRCMQLFKNHAALYIGGGFTRDSEPMKEWNETERKSETLMRFL